VSLWWGAETGAAQHPAHGGSADSMPEATQLARDAAESPTRGFSAPSRVMSSRSSSVRGGRPGDGG
jgi:hypothetical protein